MSLAFTPIVSGVGLGGALGISLEKWYEAAIDIAVARGVSG
jgi:hypothetical protein